MSAATWLEQLVRVVSWLCTYLVLVLGQSWLERYVLARFQGRPGSASPVLPLARSHSRPLYALIAVVGLLGGAAIPLTSEVRLAGQRIVLHLFGDSAAGPVLVLASVWISVALLGMPGNDPVSELATARHVAGTALLCALPMALILSSLFITGSALNTGTQNSLALTLLIDLQGTWGGMRWLGFLQPVACTLWIACIAPLRAGAQQRVTLAWHVTALNCTLLTSTLFLGGWQGPLAAQRAGLGLLYTVLKVAALSLVQVWVEASLPRIHGTRYARAIWTLYVPLALLNMVLTTGVVTMQ